MTRHTQGRAGATRTWVLVALGVAATTAAGVLWVRSAFSPEPVLEEMRRAEAAGFPTKWAEVAAAVPDGGAGAAVAAVVAESADALREAERLEDVLRPQEHGFRREVSVVARRDAEALAARCGDAARRLAAALDAPRVVLPPGGVVDGAPEVGDARTLLDAATILATVARFGGDDAARRPAREALVRLGARIEPRAWIEAAAADAVVETALHVLREAVVERGFPAADAMPLLSDVAPASVGRHARAMRGEMAFLLDHARATGAESGRLDPLWRDLASGIARLRLAATATPESCEAVAAEIDRAGRPRVVADVGRGLARARRTDVARAVAAAAVALKAAVERGAPWPADRAEFVRAVGGSVPAAVLDLHRVRYETGPSYVAVESADGSEGPPSPLLRWEFPR